MGGINIVNVPYKDAAQWLSDLMSGEVHIGFDGGSTRQAHIDPGRLRCLGITRSKPSPVFPEISTIASTGLPGYEWTSQLAMFARSKTPPANIGKPHQEIVRALGQPDVKGKLLNVGIEQVGSSPEQLAALVKSAQARLETLIKDARIRVD